MALAVPPPGAPAVLGPPMAAETTGAVFASTIATRLDRDVSAPASVGLKPGLASGSGPGPAPLSASLHEHGFGHGHSHSTSASSDPSLEPTIRSLLEQQAEIEAKLAALLPRKYGPNIRVELDMLRHKLRVLRAFASDNREYLYFFEETLYFWNLFSFFTPSVSELL